MARSVGMQRKRMGTRGAEPVRLGQRLGQGRSDREGVQGMLACRAKLAGTQGTFCWIGVFRPPAVLAKHPVTISEAYLPAFAPHLRLKPQRDDPMKVGQWFEVRLLRGTPNYLEQVHRVDWEAYLKSKEVHEEARRMEQGVVPRLLAAGEAGDNAALEALVGNRADPDWANAVGTTALHMAAFHGHAGTAALLATLNANVNIVDIFEVSPIQKAARRGHQEVVDTLVLVGADVNHVDMWESNALHWAAASLHGREARAHLELLEGFGANAKQKNLDGLQPRRVLAAGVARGYMWARGGQVAFEAESEEDAASASGRASHAGSEGRHAAPPREEEQREEGEDEDREQTRPVRRLLAAVGITSTS